MTLGRTDDPENPLGAQACQSRRSVWGWIADPIWASGHAPREKAGHMIAIDPPVRFLIFPLASKGPPTHAPTPYPLIIGFVYAKVRKATPATVTVQAQDLPAEDEHIRS